MDQRNARFPESLYSTPDRSAFSFLQSTHRALAISDFVARAFADMIRKQELYKGAPNTGSA